MLWQIWAATKQNHNPLSLVSIQYRNRGATTVLPSYRLCQKPKQCWVADQYWTKYPDWNADRRPLTTWEHFVSLYYLSHQIFCLGRRLVEGLQRTRAVDCKKQKGLPGRMYSKLLMFLFSAVVFSSFFGFPITKSVVKFALRNQRWPCI